MVDRRKYPLFKFDLDLGVTKCCRVPPHHVTNGPGKFEVATPNGLRNTFKSKYITCKVLSFNDLRLRKKIHYLISDPDLWFKAT